MRLLTKVTKQQRVEGLLPAGELPAPPRASKIYYDDEVKGFGLRVTAAGARAFILTYRINGRQRRVTIGKFPDWSVAAARDEAARLKRMIDTGTDPLARREAARSDATVADVVGEYCEAHVDGLKSAKAIRGVFRRGVLPRLGRMKVKEVRRADVIELVEGKAEDHPRAAAVLLHTVRGMLDWAADREYIEFNPAAGLKPKSIKPKGNRNAMRAEARRRVLDDDEIRAFWHNVESCGLHLLTALSLKLILVTGQRPGEVAGMEWGEITGDVWTIPAARRGKDQRDHAVPLTDTALELIERARAEVGRLSVRRRWDSGDHVFAARDSGGLTVGALGRSVRRKANALGNKEHNTLGYWTPHDLRRTARTGLAAAGVPAEIAERVIGHNIGGIEAVYNQHAFDLEKRAALEAWERRLLGVIEPAECLPNVVTITAANGGV